MGQGRQELRRVVFGCVATLALAVIIAVLTLAQMPPAGPAGSDKFYHIMAFACLAFPLPVVRPQLTFWVILGVTVYGGAIELIQPLFGRQTEGADFLADGFGAVFGALFARHLGKWVHTYYEE